MLYSGWAISLIIFILFSNQIWFLSVFLKRNYKEWKIFLKTAFMSNRSVDDLIPTETSFKVFL